MSTIPCALCPEDAIRLSQDGRRFIETASQRQGERQDRPHLGSSQGRNRRRLLVYRQTS